MDILNTLLVLAVGFAVVAGVYFLVKYAISLAFEIAKWALLGMLFILCLPFKMLFGAISNKSTT